jgi:hypothetical protein
MPQTPGRNDGVALTVGRFGFPHPASIRFMPGTAAGRHRFSGRSLLVHAVCRAKS